MNNFQHASKSDILTEDLNEEPKVEESLETSQPLEPPAIVLNFQDSAVVDGIHGGVKVEVPNEAIDSDIGSDDESLLDPDVFEGDPPVVPSEAAPELDPELNDEVSNEAGDESSEEPTKAEVFDVSLFDSVVDGEEAQQAFVERTFSAEIDEESDAPPTSSDLTDAGELLSSEDGIPPVLAVDVDVDAGHSALETHSTEVSAPKVTDSDGEDAGEYEVEAYEYEEYDYEGDEADSSETFETTGEVMEVEVIDSEEHDRSYEVYQQGSLTYFRYYLDDEENGGAYEHDVPISPKPFLSAGAMGVGVLAATFGVGLLVAETTNRRANVAAEGGPDSEQRQVDGKTEVTSAIKTDKLKPEKGKPDWSAADKPLGKSLAAKTGSDGTSGLSPTETLASAAAEKVSGTATSVDADIEVAQAGASADSSLPTWRTSVTVPPYVPPVASSSAASYQVVPMAPLAPVSLANLSSASTVVAPTASDEDRRLAMRIDALRQAAEAPATLPNPATVSSLPPEAVTVAPSGTGSTSVTDPIQPMQPIPEASYRPTPSPSSAGFVPGSSGPKIETLPLGAEQGEFRGTTTQDSEPVAAAPTLLDTPVNPVPYELQERFEARKRLMNEAIAQPVAGLLVVPLAANDFDEKQSAVPLDVIPQEADSVELETATPVTIPTEIDASDTDSPDVNSPDMGSPTNSAAVSAPEVMALEPSLLEAEPLDAGTLDTEASATESSSVPIAESTPIVDASAVPQVVSTSEIAEPEVSGVSLVASLSELLTLAQRPKEAMLQPIASEVAQEIRGAETLEQFRILALNNNDYEQLWRMRATQPNANLLAPAHGFVDYQRNEIALIDSQASGLAQVKPEVQREEVKQIARALTPVAGELKK